MTAYSVTLLQDSADNLRMALGLCTDHKKYCRDIMGFEDIQKFGRDPGIRTIVKR